MNSRKKKAKLLLKENEENGELIRYLENCLN